MPSPFGHALAGAAIGFALRPASPRIGADTNRWLFPVAGAAMAALPDTDLLIPHFHRTATHSVAATLLVLILTIVVTGKVTGKTSWRLTVLLGAAHASHLLLDWLGVDRNPPSGVQLLWPLSREFLISGWDVFPPTDRRLFQGTHALATNVHAFVVELAQVGPLVLLAWWATRTRRSRVPISDRGNPQRPSA